MLWPRGWRLMMCEIEQQSRNVFYWVCLFFLLWWLVCLHSFHVHNTEICPVWCQYPVRLSTGRIWMDLGDFYHYATIHGNGDDCSPVILPQCIITLVQQIPPHMYNCTCCKHTLEYLREQWKSSHMPLCPPSGLSLLTPLWETGSVCWRHFAGSVCLLLCAVCGLPQQVLLYCSVLVV